MKKLALLAIATLAVTSQAANIKWDIGSFLYGVKDGTATRAYTSSLMPDMANSSFVLVYLGVNASAITADKIGADGVTSTIVDTVGILDFITTSGRESNIGKANKQQTTTVADVEGATYQIFYLNNGTYSDIYTDADMTTKAQSVTVLAKDGAGAFSSSPSPLHAVGSASASAYVDVSSPIPEPATGALALAGVALLFKRRRA